MNAAVEADRALLRRRAEELPTVGLCAVAATTDELVDPLVLPTQMAVDDDVVEACRVCSARSGAGCSRRPRRWPRCRRRWRALGPPGSWPTRT